MKKGYKKLLIFEFIIIFLLLLSSFVSSILSEYLKILFLIIVLILFKLLFGFEKDRHRYTKTICIDLIIYLLIYFLVYYLSGIFFTFVKTPNYLNYDGLIKVIIPIILTLIIKEVLRYMILKKSEGSKLLIIMTCLLFICFDLVGTYSYDVLSSPYSIFTYIAVSVLPTISENIFCSYVSYKSGYKPAIMYLLIKKIYIIFVPFVPNPNEYLHSVIELIIPMIYLYLIYKFYKKEKDEQIVQENNKKRMINLIIPSLIVVFLVYITSGYFHYHAIVIASGSMTPNIQKGDVVIIEKVDNKKTIKEGQVLAYKYGNIIIVHRIVKKVQIDQDVYYYTKGDANNDVDNYKIEESQVIGVVNVKIPYIGYPTIWIKEL